MIDRSFCRIPICHDAVLYEGFNGTVGSIELTGYAVDVRGRLGRV